jgi:hypothetical protein
MSNPLINLQFNSNSQNALSEAKRSRTCGYRWTKNTHVTLIGLTHLPVRRQRAKAKGMGDREQNSLDSARGREWREKKEALNATTAF